MSSIDNIAELNARFNATRHAIVEDPDPWGYLIGDDEGCEECGQLEGSCICRVERRRRRLLGERVSQ